MANSTNSDDSYNLLLDDIANLYEESIGAGVRQRNEQLVASFWEIGDRIITGEKRAGIVERYGKKLVLQLSVDLTARFGDGFGRTNMFAIRRFRLTYERDELNDFLTWSHYKTLLSVRDPQIRSALEREVVAQRLSDTRLQEMVRQAKPRKVAQSGEALLHPRKGRLHLYRVVTKERRGRKQHLLDCGFNVTRKVRLNGIKRLSDGDYLASEKVAENEYRFELTECEGGERYCYLAELLDVVDGDTLVLRVDVGFDTFVVERFRLRGIDAPEVQTADGRRAKQYVTRRVKPGSPVLLFTYGCDMYGRYLADVFYSTARVARHPSVATGRFLNLELIENGYARYYGGKRYSP
ncbi:MAG: thermonuclease family protein [Deltaproteobacteria bacterium]|nr:thermonuclease family protein [Deltaproteobacteria bacterium]